MKLFNPDKFRVTSAWIASWQTYLHINSSVLVKNKQLRHVNLPVALLSSDSLLGSFEVHNTFWLMNIFRNFLWRLWKSFKKIKVLLKALNPTFIDMTWLIVTLLALILLWVILIAHEFPIQWKFISADRNSRLEMFCKKGVLEKFLKFTEKHLCQWIPVKFAKFSRTRFFIEKKNWWLLRRSFVTMIGSVEIAISLIWKILLWLTRYFC